MYVIFIFILILIFILIYLSWNTGPVLVYLGGYEAPPKFTLYGGICLIIALAMNR